VQVGDLVKIKHASDTIGIVTQVGDIGSGVTFRVNANWLHLDMREQTRYNFELEVINASR